jgi:aerobic carbon-monoxide dehydrogenase medium subunit
MKPAPFKYVRAETPLHAVELLREHGSEARLLAGGQTLIPMMNLRLVRPEVLVDIGRLPLSEISAKPGSIGIGALARHRDVIANFDVRAASRIVPQAMKHIAHPTIRNQGTAGGSIAHADATAELCALAVLLDGEIEALSAQGQRSIAGADYFLGAFTTALGADEMITAIHLHPPATPHGSGFLEVSERKGDFAIAAAGAIIVIKNGKIEDARIVLSGAASVPVRAQAAEALLLGGLPSPTLIEEVGAAAVEGRDCYDDIRASAAYRKELLKSLVSRAVSQSCSEAKGELDA